MSMSNYANYVIYFPEEKVKKIVGKKIYGDFDLETEGYEAYCNNESKHYSRIREAFLKKTGIYLLLGWNDPETSEPGDGVCGSFWHLDFDSIYQVTDVAKRLEGWEFTTFVTYG